ncbi:MAG TPA: hypothetical protein DCE41_12905 [Cytophagales bacterium]|nr:hypothetical protein [Cytophagales bacterium]HAA21355.1 hypothetical protein [Cytophagales bacterium]HAP65037.1 hypothetical protein [Cytophagales bacterium]
MKKLHYISGILLALFSAAHLFNHLCSMAGPESHITLMNNLRKVYRNPVIETLLLLAVGVQIMSGLQLFRKQRKATLSPFQKLQVWSGLYLAMFLLVHVGAVLAGRLVFQLDTNVYFAAVGMNTFPFNLFFLPYYTLAILAIFCHLAAVHAQKMKRTLLGLSPIRQGQLMVVLGGLMAGCILYGFTGGFQGMETPTEYGVMVGK